LVCKILKNLDKTLICIVFLFGSSFPILCVFTQNWTRILSKGFLLV